MFSAIYWFVAISNDFDNLGISGIGRQPAPFEETKENAIPPTPGAGLIAAGRIPGGKLFGTF